MQFQNAIGGVVSGSTIQIDPVDASSSGAVGSGATDTVTISPPVGWIYRVRSMKLFALAPAGATLGNHAFAVVAQAGLTEYYTFNGVSVFDRDVSFDVGQWKVANLVTDPPSGPAQQLALAGLAATDASPLKIRYFNTTDVAQNVVRVILFTFERVAI